AVRDSDIPALLDHPCDVPAGLSRCDVLVADRLVHTVLDQRVAADRHDRGSPCHDRSYSMAPSTRASSAMRMTTPLNASNQYRACRVESTSGGSSSMRGSECRTMASLFARSRSSSRVTR